MPPDNSYNNPGAQPDYSFITDPAPAPRKGLPGSGSMLGRVIVVALILTVLIIVFAVGSSLLKGPSAYPEFIGVAQDQTAILNTATTAEEEPSLSDSNRNFLLTTKLSMTTARSDILKYLRTNHQKVDPNKLNLKVKQSTGTQLSQAALASTYNETFKQIMKDQLTSYRSDMQTAYSHTKGKNGRALLSKQYDEAGLLLKQLGVPTD